MSFFSVHVVNARSDVNAPVPTYDTTGHPRAFSVHALVFPATAFCVTRRIARSARSVGVVIPMYSSV